MQLNDRVKHEEYGKGTIVIVGQVYDPPITYEAYQHPTGDDVTIPSVIVHFDSGEFKRFRGNETYHLEVQ